MGAVETAVQQATANLAATYGPAIAALFGFMMLVIVVLGLVVRTLYNKMWTIKDAADKEVARLQEAKNADMRHSQQRETDLVERLENIAEGAGINMRRSRQ